MMAEHFYLAKSSLFYCNLVFDYTRSLQSLQNLNLWVKGIQLGLKWSAFLRDELGPSFWKAGVSSQQFWYEYLVDLAHDIRLLEKLREGNASLYLSWRKSW